MKDSFWGRIVLAVVLPGIAVFILAGALLPASGTGAAEAGSGINVLVTVDLPSTLRKKLEREPDNPFIQYEYALSQVHLWMLQETISSKEGKLEYLIYRPEYTERNEDWSLSVFIMEREAGRSLNEGYGGVVWSARNAARKENAILVWIDASRQEVRSQAVQELIRTLQVRYSIPVSRTRLVAQLEKPDLLLGTAPLPVSSLLLFYDGNLAGSSLPEGRIIWVSHDPLESPGFAAVNWDGKGAWKVPDPDAGYWKIIRSWQKLEQPASGTGLYGLQEPESDLILPASFMDMTWLENGIDWLLEDVQ